MQQSEISRCVIRPALVARHKELSNQAESEGLDFAQQCEIFSVQRRIEELDAMPDTGRGLEQSGRPITQPQGDTFAVKFGSGWSTAVGPQQSISECTGGQRDNYVSFGEWLANEISGTPQTFAALTVSKDAGGGFAVPQILAANIIDTARARQVCVKAGARTIALPPAQSYSFAKIATDPTTTWRREAAPITASDPVFEQITMYPKTCGILIPITRELMEDCLNMSSVLETAVAGAIASAMDYACIQGPGGASPTGVVNAGGTTSASLAGAIWQWDNAVAMWETPLVNNAPDYPTAMLLSPQAEIHRRTLKDGDGQYQLIGQTPLATVPALCSSNVPATTLIQGDFSQMVIGIRTDLKLEMLDAGVGTAASGDTFNATVQLGSWLRAYVRMDVALMRAEWFSILTNVSNA